MNLAGSDAILGRLLQLHPKKIDLVLDRILRLLADLGHPERHLPPVIHVAGTNGKGSVSGYCAAIMAAAWAVVRATGQTGWVDSIWTFGVGATAAVLAVLNPSAAWAGGDAVKTTEATGQAPVAGDLLAARERASMVSSSSRMDWSAEVRSARQSELVWSRRAASW